MRESYYMSTYTQAKEDLIAVLSIALDDENGMSMY